MIVNKMHRIWRNSVRGDEPFGAFAIIRELQGMEHIWMPFTKHGFP
jgi:hypothetical protein